MQNKKPLNIICDFILFLTSYFQKDTETRTQNGKTKKNLANSRKLAFQVFVVSESCITNINMVMLQSRDRLTQMSRREIAAKLSCPILCNEPVDDDVAIIGEPVDVSLNVQQRLGDGRSTRTNRTTR